MSPTRDNDEERERPSWREIDQRRDRPGRRERPAPKIPKKQAEWVRKLVLRQAEALFKGKRGRPEYQTALKKLEESHGTRKFFTVAQKFLDEYGLPEEWGALQLFLDYPDTTVVCEALAAMASQLGSRSRLERQGFAGRLKVLALTSPQAEVRRQAEELLEKI
jgi:hypothetical protein|uniref:Uncharacterized protein n=1 Tax=Desulfobacca acetoxidans TaxID=60893 RepID=A0A7V6A3Z4_9BACT